MSIIQHPPRVGNLLVHFTWFDSVKNAQGQEYQSDWNSLCNWMEKLPPAAEKAAQPLIKFATFDGSYRSGENLRQLYGVEADYDAGVLPPEQAVSILQAAGIEAFVYTTAQHTPERPRWRVLAPLPAPVDAAQREDYVRALDAVLGNVLAPESYTAAQAYFIGGTVGKPQRCWRVEGRCIDPVASPPALSIARRTNAGKRAPSYQVALDALKSIDPADLDRNEWLVISGAFFTATIGLASPETQEKDWAEWNAGYAAGHPTYDAQADLRAWRDFTRDGTEGDFTTLAMLSENDNAKGWALFGGVVHNVNPMVISERPRGKFRLIRESDLKACAASWLVEKIIPEGALSLFFGPSGSAKTFGALSLGLCIASGSPWFGHTVQQGDVIYVCGEGKSGIKKRIQVWKTCNGRQNDKLPFFVSEHSVNFADAGTVDDIKETVAYMGIRPRLIIIDTLARNTTADENDSKEMSGFIKALDNLKDASGASVLLVHHTGHAEKDRARGSSVLKAAMDSEFRFEKTDNTIKFTCTKMKDADEPAPIAFELKPIPFAADGFPEMGAVLVAAENAPARLSPQNQAALEILKSHNFIISRSEFERKLICNGVTKADQRNFQRIISRMLTELKASGALSEEFAFLEG